MGWTRMLQLFNFLNPFVEAFFFSFFVEVALPLVPDLEYFRFLLIVVAFGRFFYSLGRYPMDSIAAIICEHVTMDGKEQYCLGSPCSPKTIIQNIQLIVCPKRKRCLLWNQWNPVFQNKCFGSLQNSGTWDICLLYSLWSANSLDIEIRYI